MGCKVKGVRYVLSMVISKSLIIYGENKARRFVPKQVAKLVLKACVMPLIDWCDYG